MAETGAHNARVGGDSEFDASRMSHVWAGRGSDAEAGGTSPEGAGGVLGEPDRLGSVVGRGLAAASCVTDVVGRPLPARNAPVFSRRGAVRTWLVALRAVHLVGLSVHGPGSSGQLPYCCAYSSAKDWSILSSATVLQHVGDGPSGFG